MFTAGWLFAETGFTGARPFLIAGGLAVQLAFLLDQLGLVIVVCRQSLRVAALWPRANASGSVLVPVRLVAIGYVSFRYGPSLAPLELRNHASPRSEADGGTRSRTFASGMRALKDVG
jgi:hypothetical protein